MRGTLKAYGDIDPRVWVADSFEGLPPRIPRETAASLTRDRVRWPFLSMK